MCRSTMHCARKVTGRSSQASTEKQTAVYLYWGKDHQIVVRKSWSGCTPF